MGICQERVVDHWEFPNLPDRPTTIYASVNNHLSYVQNSVPSVHSKNQNTNNEQDQNAELLIQDTYKIQNHRRLITFLFTVYQKWPQTTKYIHMAHRLLSYTIVQKVSIH